MQRFSSAALWDDKMVVLPGGELYVSRVNYIYHSTDSGISWKDSSLIPGIYISSLYADTAGRVFAGTGDYNFGGELYRSTDRGVSWSLTPYSGGHVYDINISQAGYLFVMGNSMQRSGDYGNTFTGLSGSFPINTFNAVGFTAAGTVLVGSQWGYIYRSSDNGANWTVIHLGSSFYPNVTCITLSKAGKVYAANVYGALFISADDGLSWAERGLGFDTPSKIVVNDLNHIFVSSRWGSGVVWSTNDGASWSNVSRGLPDSAISSLGMDSLGYLYAASQTGLNRSIDHTHGKIKLTAPNGGEVWTGLTTNTITWTHFFLTRVRIDYSTDGGQVWLPVAQNIQAAAGKYVWRVPHTPSANCLVRIASETNTNLYDVSDRAFTIAPPPILVKTPNGGEQLGIGTIDTVLWENPYNLNTRVELSTNNGLSWCLLANNVAGTLSSYLWPVPDTPSSVCKLRVLSMADSLTGDTSDNVFTINMWAAITNNLSPGNCKVVVEDRFGRIIVGASNGIYRSSDGGTNWEQLNNGLSTVDIYCLSFSKTGDLYAGTWGGGLFRSTDYGAQWTALGPAGTKVQAVLVRGTEIFIGTLSQGVYRSADNGVTWEQRNSGMTSLNTAALLNANGYLWAATSGGGLYRTTNSGSAWVQTGQYTGLNSSFILSLGLTSQNKMLAGTSNGIFRSLDGTGGSWERVGPGVIATEWVYSFAAHAGPLLFAGGGANVHFSKDYGATWQAIGIGGARGLIIAADGSLLAANSGSAIYRSRPMLDVNVITPRGGEVLISGENTTVTWNSRYVSRVLLEYTTNNGAAWAWITNTLPAQQGSYTWQVPAEASAQCRVRISDAADAAHYDMSDSVFTIRVLPPPEVTLTLPLNNAVGVPLRSALTWGSIAGAQRFNVQVGFDSLFNSILTDTLVQGYVATYQPYYLTYSTRYYWRVRAQNTIGWGSWGAGRTFTTAALLFTPPAITLTGVNNSASAWGDYDNDGDLDIIIAGSYTTKLYKNNRNGTFTEVTGTGFTGIDGASLVWVDYDNDGDLDVVISGSYITKLYKNNGNGSFTEVTGTGLTGADIGSVTCRDFNNDGLQDLLVTGSTGSVPVSKLYKNSGNGAFTEVGTPFPQLSMSAASWADYNSDGYADVLLTGYTGSSFVTKLFKNNRAGGFTEAGTGYIPGVRLSAAAWSDYDNDGKPDFVASGQDSTYQGKTMLYRNMGNDVFTETAAANLQVLEMAGAGWGDYDNDGKPDLVLSGNVPGYGTTYSALYKNMGSGQFVSQTNAGLAAFRDGSVSWGDYDLDGDLDLLLTGNQVSKVYKNLGTAANAVPAVPAGLKDSVANGRAMLSWQPATDAETPQPGLTYNLCIGTAPGLGNVLSPMANTATGLRLIAERGSVQGTEYEINNLSHGKYYWSVQAIDGAFAGSAFAPLDSFFFYERPAAPAPLLPANNAVRQSVPLRLVWAKAVRAEQYTVEVSEYQNFASTAILDSTVTDTFYNAANLLPLKVYYWRVKARNPGGEGVYSAVWSFRTLGVPVQVQLLTPANNSINRQTASLLFSWRQAAEQKSAAPGSPARVLQPTDAAERNESAADGVLNTGFVPEGGTSVSAYQLQVTADTSGSTFFCNDSLVTDTVKTLNGLAYSVQYFWRVKGKNQTGWGEFSGWYRFTTMPERPARPLLLSPADGSIGMVRPVTLAWNRAARAEKFTLEVSETPLFSVLTLRDTALTDTAKTVSVLAEFRRYYWRVYAGNAGGISDTSAVWSFKLTGAPLPVTLAYPANNGVNIPAALTFTWQKAGVQEALPLYWFELAEDSAGALLLKDTALTDTARTAQLLNAKTYYWRVKAANAAGWGRFSAWRVFSTIPPVPGVPVLLLPAQNASGAALLPRLVWGKTPYAQQYRLQLSADSLFGGYLINDSTVTDTARVTDTLQYKTRYYWRVQSSNAAGRSTFSSTRVFTTRVRPIPAPGALAAVPAGMHRVNLSWRDNSANESGFIVFRKSGDSTSAAQLIPVDSVSANTTVFADTAVQAGTLYSYRVIAFNLDSISAFSNYATVTTLTSIQPLPGGVPAEFSMPQNFPNPFNPATTIAYGLPKASFVKIELFDLSGQLLKTVLESDQAAGFYELRLNLELLASGTYLCLLTAKEVEGGKLYSKANKIVLMK